MSRLELRLGFHLASNPSLELVGCRGCTLLCGRVTVQVRVRVNVRVRVWARLGVGASVQGSAWGEG